MQPFSIIRSTIVVLIALAATASAYEQSQATRQDLERDFVGVVHPFLQAHCFSCHGQKKQEASLDLHAYSTIHAIAKDHGIWKLVLERLEAEEMPPEEAVRKPTPAQRGIVIAWIKAMRRDEAQRHAGDPGSVLARRLSNSEYDFSVRDLTGVDIRPTREFPVDPANEAGFDNSGESLAMSPALLNKYLVAARHVADHVVLKPKGFIFAPHPAVTDTDRDKYSVKRIIDFYSRQRMDLADYFFSAWRFEHRDTTETPQPTLARLAVEKGISARYLSTVWTTLAVSEHSAGPLAELQTMWRSLPEANTADLETVRRGCEQMRDYVIREREKLKPKIQNLALKGISNGSQPLVLWKNRQYAAFHLRCASDLPIADGPDRTYPPDGKPLHQFCRIFPDAFFVSERDRVFLDSKERNSGRLLSAGFHLMVGYFRDDRPLYELMLSDREREELDELWLELDFITSAPMRQYKDFIFFERAEPPRFMGEAKFDFARSEDKDAILASNIQRLSELYIAKARENGGESDAIKAVEDYFTNISADICRVESARLTAEPSHLDSLLVFAEQAYRRPLSAAERDDLIAFYSSSREEQRLSHEDAIRDAVVSILMSPHFCYRVDLPQAGTATHSLSDYSLASRLSYFLWSSVPDSELLNHARTGDLHSPEILVAQTRRMLQDERVRGLATEFGGNWLDIRRFEEHNSVDRERFAEFTNELREAMFEEPIRFFVDVVRENGSILDFLYARHTFVNPSLAKHYGIPLNPVEPDAWIRVDDAQTYDRGGLLPMAVFLTKNAPGLRTSPVKRGYWVIRRLLGENVPPPPPTVPELPKDEAKLGELSLRQLLAQHRDNKSCAGCHERFDSIGLAFEGYGPIGERREIDLGGRPVDSHAIFPDGTEGTGLDGLRSYLRAHRQDEFVDNLCRKLLAYALGRSLQLSDDGLLESMKTKLASNGYRFDILIEAIVTSPQFLNRRARDYDITK